MHRATVLPSPRETAMPRITTLAAQALIAFAGARDLIGPAPRT